VPISLTPPKSPREKQDYSHRIKGLTKQYPSPILLRDASAESKRAYNEKLRGHLSGLPANPTELDYMNKRSTELAKKTKGRFSPLNFFMEENRGSDLVNMGLKGPDISERLWGVKAGGRRVPRGDIGNFFVGVNAQRSGMPIGAVKLGAGFSAAKGRFFENSWKGVRAGVGKVLTKALGGELPEYTHMYGKVGDEADDWLLYQAGYDLAKQLEKEGRTDITEKELEKYLMPHVSYWDTHTGGTNPEQTRKVLTGLSKKKRAELLRRMTRAGLTS